MEDIMARTAGAKNANESILIDSRTAVAMIRKHARCPINRGAHVELSKFGIVHTCLARQKRIVNCMGQHDWKLCDEDCKTGEDIKEKGMDINLKQIKIPRNITIMSKAKLARLKKKYSAEIERFKPSDYYIPSGW